MKFTLLHQTHQGMNRYSISGIAIIAVFLLALVMTAFGSVFLTLKFNHNVSPSVTNTQESLAAMKLSLAQTEVQLKEAKKKTDLQINEFTRRIGQIQAEILRINAVGMRLLTTAGLNTKEFDFDKTPAIGGPESTANQPLQQNDLLIPLVDFQQQLLSKKNQMAILESVLLNKEMDISSYISGRPVKSGWNSSVFGKRIDPFTGHEAWHEGMDFAGKLGDPIVATAAGVVSFVGKKSGYGLTVEINHGNNIKTRYGHNQKTLVSVGTIVEKGDVIAQMGSSGRSTGPHVHYEVLKSNRAVNPKKYVWRRAK